MNSDERELYRILFKCKEALMIILEEAQEGQDWSVVHDEATNALDEFED